MKITYLFAGVFVLGLIGLGYMHESAHVEIFRSYGVVSHIEYFSSFPDLATVPTYHPERCTGNCVLAHDLNEVVGYQLIMIYFMVGFGLLCLVGIAETFFYSSTERKIR